MVPWVKYPAVVTAANGVAAVVQVQSLPRELPHAACIAGKKKKKSKITSQKHLKARVWGERERVGIIPKADLGGHWERGS